jgi:hypothetical protein
VLVLGFILAAGSLIFNVQAVRYAIRVSSDLERGSVPKATEATRHFHSPDPAVVYERHVSYIIGANSDAPSIVEEKGLESNARHSGS